MKVRAEASKFAAEQEAQAILAKGDAEAEAILKKAEAMKKMGEASVLELILNSHVLPEVVKAYSEPLASAYSKIDSITMYGEGNTAKLAEEIGKNGSQLMDGLEITLGIDIKSLLAGYLGANIINKNGKKEETPSINTDKEEDNEEKKED